MSKGRMIPIRVLLKVEELWDCEIEVPADVQGEEAIRKFVEDHQMDIDYECQRESWPGDIIEIEIDKEEENG